MSKTDIYSSFIVVSKVLVAGVVGAAPSLLCAAGIYSQVPDAPAWCDFAVVTGAAGGALLGCNLNMLKMPSNKAGKALRRFVFG